MKRAAASVVATAASLYLITVYDGSPVAVAEDTTSTGTSALDGSASTPLATPGGTSNSAGSSGTTSSNTPSNIPSTAAGGERKTVAGAAADTGYGDLKVTLVVEGKEIVDVKATQASPNATSRGISAGAIPKLQTQALQAQTASINGVSGASLTTQGFKTSLASAVKNAGL